MARKESSTFGDHLGREHFKHQLEERLGDRLGEQLGDRLGDHLGDHLGLQPLHQFEQDALPAPHLDLTLVRSHRLPDQQGSHGNVHFLETSLNSSDFETVNHTADSMTKRGLKQKSKIIRKTAPPSLLFCWGLLGGVC